MHKSKKMRTFAANIQTQQQTLFFMKSSKLLSALMSSLIILVIAGCEPNPIDKPDVNPGTTEEEVDHFERTILLEQFTSENCVNCPTGVAQIENYLSSHKNVVWLSHHAGYDTDSWTISGSNSIARLLGVQGAPSVALDRSLLNAQGASGYNLHPYYLSYLTSAPSATTTASVRISNTCEDGKVKIHVAGKLKAEAPQNLLLSVVIKESGLHGKQLDPQHTLAGMWEDYVHSDVIRAFVSATGGDPIAQDGGQYEADYEIELHPDWVADNCMVVAFLTDEKSLNVVQTAEKPVVEGTKGGADLAHGGVTPKAVPDGYPEGNYSIADFIKADTVHFQFAQAGYGLLENGVREWHIMAWTTMQTYGSGQNIHFPFADIVFFTEANVGRVPTEGEWDFVVARSLDEIVTSTAWAGYCDLDAQMLVGSELQMVNKAQFEVGNIVPGTNGQWLIANGKILFKENGFEVNASSAKGKPIHLKFEGTYRY